MTFSREHKVKARSAVYIALNNGTLKQPDRCADCQSKRQLHAHHPDYRKPLDVIWLCVPCHKKAHGTWGRKRTRPLPSKERTTMVGRPIKLDLNARQKAKLREAQRMVVWSKIVGDLWSRGLLRHRVSTDDYTLSQKGQRWLAALEREEG